MSFRRDATETAQVGCLTWILMGSIGLAAIAITVVSTGLHYAAMPWLRQQETAINRSSQGYVDAKQAVLLKLTQDAFRLSAEIDRDRTAGNDTRSAEAQLKASLDAIEREAATIAPDKIPPQTRDLFMRHGRML